MTDYHAPQMTGHRCGPYNCAAASIAMALHAATDGKVTITSDQARADSGVSCTPGVHSKSGGLFISDVIRVAAKYGVTIDYGVGPATYRRWTLDEGKQRLGSGMAAVVLGDYDQVPGPYRAPGSTFMGDHSAFAHDYRASDDTVCWGDPLRKEPHIRLPWRVFAAYWWKPNHPLRGYAGWVSDPHVKTSAEAEMFPVVRYQMFREPQTWLTRPGTTLHGYDPARPGAPVLSRTWSVASPALADALVSVAWVGTGTAPIPRGSGFLSVTNGVYAGLLIVRSMVEFTDEPPVEDQKAAYNAGRQAVIDAALKVPQR